MSWWFIYVTELLSNNNSKIHTLTRTQYMANVWETRGRERKRAKWRYLSNLVYFIVNKLFSAASIHTEMQMHFVGWDNINILIVITCASFMWMTRAHCRSIVPWWKINCLSMHSSKLFVIAAAVDAMHFTVWSWIWRMPVSLLGAFVAGNRPMYDSRTSRWSQRLLRLTVAWNGF